MKKHVLVIVGVGVIVVSLMATSLVPGPKFYLHMVALFLGWHIPSWVVQVWMWIQLRKKRVRISTIRQRMRRRMPRYLNTMLFILFLFGVAGALTLKSLTYNLTRHELLGTVSQEIFTYTAIGVMSSFLLVYRYVRGQIMVTELMTRSCLNCGYQIALSADHGPVRCSECGLVAEDGDG